MKKHSKPIDTIVIHNTEAVAGCGPEDSVQVWKDEIETIHVAGRGWDAVGYHYLVQPWTGEVLQTRPLDMMGSHVKGHNNGSIGIGVCGDFREEDLYSTEVVETIGKIPVSDEMPYSFTQSMPLIRRPKRLPPAGVLACSELIDSLLHQVLCTEFECCHYRHDAIDSKDFYKIVGCDSGRKTQRGGALFFLRSPSIKTHRELDPTTDCGTGGILELVEALR